MPRFTLTASQRELYTFAVARYMAEHPEQAPAAIAVALSLTTMAELRAAVDAQMDAIRADLIAQEAAIDAEADAAHARLQAQIAAIDSFPF
jgi:hypothetical protein